MNRTPSEPENQDLGIGPASLDATDREIVNILRRNGRTTLTELGRATGLGTSSVHQRVRRLEERRIITGYVALVDPAVLGLPISVATVVPPLLWEVREREQMDTAREANRRHGESGFSRCRGHSRPRQ
jgi:DNA-binding Lrp family transcriptional regulator